MSSAKTSEAITYTAFGGVDVLRTVTKTVRKPADQEVVVQIPASGVNPLDIVLRGGAQNREIPSDGIVPHTDGAGTVIDIGAKVENFKIGDRVWVWGVGTDLGTAAEIAYVQVERVTSLPDNADFELGASLGIPAITAALALNRLSGSDVDLAEKPYEGKTALVRGGGAVGHFAVNWRNGRVLERL
ncbi:alcohol dehydrogenase catalytic domain-containing protein [Flaviflexus massiliensis]|uniref:alcohol dehydrogenase catalytic domain-containing protein n=1 Tax=Flaviflexus massiliensis TaxID=1522309 RepID=UPI0006D5908F|nr:alcohol dehydrogenase catalytic domain-containing protein [Flaviflexus massiliensis]